MTYLQFCNTFGFVENGLFNESSGYNGIVDAIILPPHISIAGQLFPSAAYSQIVVIATTIYQLASYFDCKEIDSCVHGVFMQFEMSIDTQRLYEIYCQYSA